MGDSTKVNKNEVFCSLELKLGLLLARPSDHITNVVIRNEILSISLTFPDRAMSYVRRGKKGKLRRKVRGK